ncbi:hypothetical protein F4802DRAFT_620126 [Xylaria palmicola]|nr:hypothetical protein F4802DRAFT_620126 [Xylaria palmicola]
MVGPSANYFTCTLGEALSLKKHDSGLPFSFQTVLELIEGRARCSPSLPALGFANPQKEVCRKELEVISFGELDELSRIAAFKLEQALSEDNQDNGSTTVGLFFYSSLDLVLSWLGLMRLGLTAIFLAPQLEVPAIEHLCDAVGAQIVLVDEAHSSQLPQLKRVNIIRVPNYDGSKEWQPNIALPRVEKGSQSSIAFVQHTSGTSSGLPNPIFQTEWGAVGCLPVFADPSPKATFTTTPLYHGGLADALRAWSSGAMVWFFPEGVMPITCKNIEQAVDLARRRSGMDTVKYFSSVPYVLQMLVEGERGAGIDLLKSMHLVGVGGAPLSPTIGNKLVKSGVALLSRMGSAECGFLMSSHRKYGEDVEWQYLRAIDNPELLAFESRDGGLSELVVKPGWPLRLKINRKDGSYATTDLFEPHPTMPNAWRYQGRKDALVILANGKKFDPSSIEDHLRASNSMIQDVLVFGAGRNYPGALLFTNYLDSSDDEWIEKVWPDIRKLNSSSPQCSKLSRSALVVVQITAGLEPLPKSSKGTILRYQAESHYAQAINQVYNGRKEKQGQIYASDNELVPFISSLFEEVLGYQVKPEEDIYAQGVDSIVCAQILKCMHETLLPSRVELSPNFIYDNGTILELAETLKRIRRGGDTLSYDCEEESLKLMQSLVEKYSNVQVSRARSSRKDTVILLTGASGTLGAHILNQLIDDSRVSKVLCLLRGRTPFAPEERIVNALIKRKLRSQENLACSGAFPNKIACFVCDLSAPNLGLSGKDRSYIASKATHIIHSAWTVNFNIGLRSFESQLSNIRSLIELANISGARFFFISSTAAVSNKASSIVAEKASSDPRDASALGYSRSKWVAEQICAAAHTQANAIDSTGSGEESRIVIIRVGQLCGNEFGAWNVSEAYPLLLSTAKLTSCLPDLPGTCLNWLPADTAAKSVIEIVLLNNNRQAAAQPRGPRIPVYHVLNHHRSPSWRQMLEWFTKEPRSTPFEIVPAATWLERLETVLATHPTPRHPCQALVGMWKERYGSKGNAGSTDSSTEGPVFEVKLARQVSRSLRTLGPLNRRQLVQMWEWIQEHC